MKRRLSTIMTTTIVVLAAYASSPARAYPIADPLPLAQYIAAAHIIAVAKILNSVPDPSKDVKPLTFDKSGRPVFATGEFSTRNAKPPEHYTFSVSLVLKGQCNATLKLDLWYIEYCYYSDAKPRFQRGDTVLLMLTEDGKGQLQPVDERIPLIPLEAPGADLSAAGGLSLQARVDRLMLYSLIDPVCRRANTFLMRDTVDPQIVEALAQYLDDPDLSTRDNVLCCLAANQQVIAIPLIAKLAEDPRMRGKADRSVASFPDYHTPEAVPFLDPLLLSTDYFLRLHAMDAEYNLADSRSVPYLMLALYDPDPQRLIPLSADVVLHKLIPSLGPQHEDDYDSGVKYFYSHRAVEIALFQGWWHDELMGLRVTKARALDVRDPARPPAAVSELNPWLFDPRVKVRRAAIHALEKLADPTSIPYLLMALHDPDAEIEYGAYQIVHRLAPETGPARPEPYFEAHTSEEVNALYGWWQDDLSGKRRPLSGPSVRR